MRWGRLGDPDRRLRELAGGGRGPEGAVLVLVLLRRRRIRRRRGREPGGGGGGGAVLAVCARHLAAHGAGGGEGLLRLGDRSRVRDAGETETTSGGLVGSVTALILLAGFVNDGVWTAWQSSL
jgi:hypothetical protein